jgi:hypothetical protein
VKVCYFTKSFSNSVILPIFNIYCANLTKNLKWDHHTRVHLSISEWYELMVGAMVGERDCLIF